MPSGEIVFQRRMYAGFPKLSSLQLLIKGVREPT
jgi:hypothetical protein